MSTYLFHVFFFLQTVASLSPVLFCFLSVRSEYKLSRLSKRTVRLTFRVNFRDVGMFSKHFHHVINLLLTRIFLHSYRENIDSCFFSKNLLALRPCCLDCSTCLSHLMVLISRRYFFVYKAQISNVSQ